MLKKGLSIFMAFVFGLQMAIAAPTSGQATSFSNMEALNRFAFSIFISQYKNVKTPADMARVLFPDRTAKEILGLEKSLAGFKKIPQLKYDGKRLIFKLDDQIATLEIVDAINNKFKINGQNYTYDPTLPLNESIRFIQERYFSEKRSALLILLLPEAHAWLQIAIMFVTAIAAASGTVIGTVGSPLICKSFHVSGCGGKDKKFENKCISDNEKSFYLVVEKPNKKKTLIKATLDNSHITQITQYYMVKDTTVEESKKVTKKETEEEEDVDPALKGWVSEGHPIIYSVEKDQLKSVEIHGIPRSESDFPKRSDGKMNDEWLAYLQLKGAVRSKINFCPKTEITDASQDPQLSAEAKKLKAKQTDSQLVQNIMTIDAINEISGSTGAQQTLTPDKVDESAISQAPNKKDVKTVSNGTAR